MAGRKFFPTPASLPPGLCIVGMGIGEAIRTGIVHRPRGGPRHLMIVAHSSMTFGAPGQPADYPAQTMIVYTPGAEQFYGRDGGAWNHSWIVFNGDDVQRELQAARVPLNSPFRIDAAIAEYYLNGLMRELSEHAAPDATVLKNLFQNWVIEIGRSAAGIALRAEIPPRYRQLRHFINESYGSKVTLQMLAGRAHVSRWHLCREFQRYFGMGPMKYLQNVRMQQAANLLRGRSLNVSEVARQCGYDDLFQFSKLFKKHYGASPREMRKRL
jgi:AraC-like DNA-binding protein